MSTSRIAATLLASAGLFLGTGATAIAGPVTGDDAALAGDRLVSPGVAASATEVPVDVPAEDAPAEDAPAVAATVLALEVAPFRLSRQLRLAA